MSKVKRARVVEKKLDFVINSRNNDNSILWTEKYRPTNIEDLVMDKSTRNKIDKIISNREMPNIIITGIPGIGKTTTILCIAKILLGKYFNHAVLELNASDDRGIKSVQDPITYFCKKKMEINDEENKYAKHKIILLDEADNMTKKAQQLVNNLVQIHHNTTRFAFTCNNSSDIIEAIQSRCIIFRYKRLKDIQVLKRLEYICDNENVEYTIEGLNAIVLTSYGDMRKAINSLQLTSKGYTRISTENVYKLCDKPHPLMIKNIFIACYNKDLREALTYLNNLREKGYSNSDISLGMINILKSNELKEIDLDTKIHYMKDICDVSIIITKGVDTHLQLSGTVAKLCK